MNSQSMGLVSKTTAFLCHTHRNLQAPQVRQAARRRPVPWAQLATRPPVQQGSLTMVPRHPCCPPAARPQTACLLSQVGELLWQCSVSCCSGMQQLHGALGAACLALHASSKHRVLLPARLQARGGCSRQAAPGWCCPAPRVTPAPHTSPEELLHKRRL